MKLIIGLGNPGKEYEETRHNVGFKALDAIAIKFNINITDKKFRAFCGSGIISGEKVLLIKPQTYMNLSGESVRKAMDFFKLSNEDIVIIYDDISLAPGQLRIRKKGSAGGHNGIKSIISHVGSEEFLRIKVGVGDKPAGRDLADYVLGKISGNEQGLMRDAYSDIVDAIELILNSDIDVAMNRFNKKNKAAKEEV